MLSAAMAVELGRISQGREPLPPVRLTEAVMVECLVDTGFTGALMVPRTVVRDLTIPVVASEIFEMVGQRFFTASVALTEVQWLGQRRIVRVIVSESSDAIIGTEMLDGNRLTIDYQNDTVNLTDERARNRI